MKILFALTVALLFVITPVYGQALSDATGLVNRLDIQTGGHTFEVQTISNFQITDFEFYKDEKKLTLYISSGLENNLSEVILPQNLLGGNLTFYLNGQEYVPQVKTNQEISFITLNFTGIGDNTLDIVGTEYLSGLTEKTTDMPPPDLMPLEDDDEGLIYITIILALLIIGGIVGTILLVIKRRK
ncbi:hypothetical protein C5F49_06800 [Nitrosopumilus oxyclinae]|uniref:Uncharacterized protein n=1 Tax=Nitrosopumilus oxyclinae TaxID=1959104 RepID=A0A7D5R406_9ARCH|nr:hypothetical protein [Nitrosopumilus oxyclinae]QLH05057.1 hypothetical protein C5F49_06800 [Nitrosopumilus oxyclinae]